jgi:hypothetical protein
MMELYDVMTGTAVVLIPFVLFTEMFARTLQVAGLDDTHPRSTIAAGGVLVAASMAAVTLTHVPAVWTLTEHLLGV